MVSYTTYATCKARRIAWTVLILIVVDDGLVPAESESKCVKLTRLNPYCSGRWSRTLINYCLCKQVLSLNPYCSGRWSRTRLQMAIDLILKVLILIVVDDGLVLIDVILYDYDVS